MSCKCFTCTHKNHRERIAYCTGYKEACEWFLNWAKAQGIKMGSISDNDLGGIYAQINCNYAETCCYVDSLIEEKKERLREQWRKYYKNNREKRIASQQKWAAKHPNYRKELYRKHALKRKQATKGEQDVNLENTRY